VVKNQITQPFLLDKMPRQPEESSGVGWGSALFDTVISPLSLKVPNRMDLPSLLYLEVHTSIT